MSWDPRAITARERFDAVAAEPGFATAMAHTPEVSGVGAIVSAAVILGFALIFTAVSVGMMDDEFPPAFFKVAWFGGCALFVSMAGGALLRAIRYHQAPIERLVAVVVHERTEVSGGDRAASTRYFVTMQPRDGIRREYGCTGELAGRVIRGDIGVCYAKMRTLVEFRRFDI